MQLETVTHGSEWKRRPQGILPTRWRVKKDDLKRRHHAYDRSWDSERVQRADHAAIITLMLKTTGSQELVFKQALR